MSRALTSIYPACPSPAKNIIAITPPDSSAAPFWRLQLISLLGTSDWVLNNGEGGGKEVKGCRNKQCRSSDIAACARKSSHIKELDYQPYDMTTMSLSLSHNLLSSVHFFLVSSAFPPLASQQHKRRAHRICPPSSMPLGQITGQPGSFINNTACSSVNRILAFVLSNSISNKKTETHLHFTCLKSMSGIKKTRTFGFVEPTVPSVARPIYPERPPSF